MALRDLSISPIYESSRHNILDDFYIPSLSNALVYKRVSAYFDSNILSFYSKGIEQIVSRNGRIKFIFSTQITAQDFDLMSKGYSERLEQVIRFSDKFVIEEITNEIKNLAFLVKHGFVDIKIAFVSPKGILHTKFGLIEDGLDKIFFRGSSNETVAAIQSNVEHFETSTTWGSDSGELNKIANAAIVFDKMWNNDYGDDVLIVDFPKVMKEKLITYAGRNLIITNLPSKDVFIMDYEDGLLCKNELTDKFPLSPSSSFFKRVFIADISSIEDNTYRFQDVSYMKINRMISDITDYSIRQNFKLYITPNLRKFLYTKDIEIHKRRSLGIAIKERSDILKPDFEHFKAIVDSEFQRKLREPQYWGAYHLARMKRGANFSVPGSGKTSIVYGAYAYLSSNAISEVDKIVMVGPINSFSSWSDEFVACFGNKRALKLFDFQKQKTARPSTTYDKIVHSSTGTNLYLFNYESLSSNIDALDKIIDDKTLLVFDEVHRVKSITGQRAEKAKEICKRANYRVVLTGTPIPNGYVDIFNLLNILFSDEYDEFFSFNEAYLESANEQEEKRITINSRIYPFFCRTNKNDLNVPPPEPDDVTSGYCITTPEESKLFELLFYKFSNNTLLLYIRLMQAANNPRLILKNIEDEVKTIFGIKNMHDRVVFNEEEIEFVNSFNMTSKFKRGIDLIMQKLNKGPIIVWANFIDTIKSIHLHLANKGISASIITGSVSIEDREAIISKFKAGETKVLITNPHTMGESISLHRTCHQAIYFDLSFNLVHFLQSKDRIHRLGLEPNATTEYTMMILDNPGSIYSPIDQKIYNRLLEKETLQSRALTSDEIYILKDDIKKDIESILARR